MDILKNIYNICEKLAPIEEGDIWIIDRTDWDNPNYLIHITSGYCIEIHKEVDGEGNEFYSIYQEWEGFKNDMTDRELLTILSDI